MLKYRAFITAILLTLPGLIIGLKILHLGPPLTALLCGLAILGASFLLTWACEVAQKDIPQGLAIAVVAFIAVLPEYAVDMYFTWMAGQDPHAAYSHYAIANMTGANRLLIGLGWSSIAIIFAVKYHHGVALDKDKYTDLLFLSLATLFALSIPLKGSLNIWDGFIFLALYIAYMLIIIRRPNSEEDVQGPAALLATLPRRLRLSITCGFFIFSALIILLNAEPFSENLVETGKIFQINEFLLVQWLAPIASEAPEFIVALMFAFRGNASLALGSLLSSKLNQWTLLVGMIPGVYAISAGTISPPINLDAHQFSEIFLTAAQSFFAISLLLNLKLNAKEGWILFILFSAQLLSPFYEEILENILSLAHDPLRIHNFFAWLYVLLGGIIFACRRKYFKPLLQGFKP